MDLLRPLTGVGKTERQGLYWQALEQERLKSVATLQGDVDETKLSYFLRQGWIEEAS
jgi:hypothetical protein